jgi:putative DNA primase/helicase
MAPGEEVVPIRADRLHHLEPLARKAVRWALDNELTIGSAEPDMPKALAGRRADNWRHLLAIADAAGGDWPERARRAAEALSGSDSGETAAIMLLADTRDIFRLRGADRLSSKDIVEALAELEDRPWAEWKAGRPITSNGLAKLLSPFKIKPKQLRFPNGRTGISGYTRDAFAETFTRYLPDATSTLLHCRDCAASEGAQTSTPKPTVEFPDRRNASNCAACRGVELQQPEAWEGEI